MNTKPDEQRQNWWVTGASSGIGRELALMLAQQGHRVFISARSQAGLEALASAHPTLLLPLPCDVSDEQAMTLLFKANSDTPLWLDGVVLSAGVCEYVDLPALEPQVFRRVFEVNFFGVVNSCRAALPLLRAASALRPGGRPQIIGIGSMASMVGFPRAEAYGASKAAMAYFLKSLRCDVGQWCDVTVVSPGFVHTPLTARNDFRMPWIWSVKQAAAYIVARIQQRKLAISFPWQLRLSLALANALPWLWYGRIAHHLTRKAIDHDTDGADA